MKISKSGILAIVIICICLLNGCSGDRGQPDDENVAIEYQETTKESELAEESKSAKQTNIEIPSEFEALTEQQLRKLPDADSLVNVVSVVLESIGVQEIEGAVYGNYDMIGSVCINLDTYVVTDLRSIVVRNQYLNNQWQVIYINDAENGNLYYPITAKNAFDYVSGECVNPVEETGTEETIGMEEEVTHREGMYGISDKDVHDIGTPSIFERNKVRNDVTGKWKISTIAEDVQMVDYALSYYEKYFYNDDEIHAIVNINYDKTTCIQYMSGLLYVTVHEYVDGEEYDAKLLFSGMILEEYVVYPDNGDIEKIQ